MNSRSFACASRRVPVFAVLLLASTSCSAKPTSFDARDPHSPVRFLRTIPLPNVHGRIDHMALDRKSKHLFVAELANGSVDDVDLVAGKVAGRITGLREPQGVAWLPEHDEVAVACGDGTVHFYNGSDRQEVARIALGDDADNVRIDNRTGDLVVGYGSGALAVINPSTHQVIRTLKLTAHPEAFEIVGSQVFVNVPDRHAIVVGDLDAALTTRIVGTGTRFGNYPMASDNSGRHIAVAFRFPSSLSIIDAKSGKTASATSVCGDADDLFFQGDRLILVCGEGAVDLASTVGKSIARVATRHGARTGFFDPDEKRLYVALPAQGSAAALWEFSVQPD